MQDYYKAVLRGEFTAVQGLNKIQAELWKLQKDDMLMQREESYELAVELNRQRKQIEVFLND